MAGNVRPPVPPYAVGYDQLSEELALDIAGIQTDLDDLKKEMKFLRPIVGVMLIIVLRDLWGILRTSLSF